MWVHLVVVAIITNIGPYFLFAWAELRVTSSLAGVLNATTPLFTLTAALATGTERHAPSRLAGLVPFVGTTPMHLSTTVIAAVLVLGVVGTGAAYPLNYQLIGDEGATAAATANYLIPMVAVILGTTLVGELITWNLVLGAVTILAGVALSEGRLAHSLRGRRVNQPANR